MQNLVFTLDVFRLARAHKLRSMHTFSSSRQIVIALTVLLLIVQLPSLASLSQQQQHRFVITFRGGTNALDQFQSTVAMCAGNLPLSNNIRRAVVDKWYGRRIILRYEYVTDAQQFLDYTVHSIREMYQGTDILLSIEDDYQLSPTSSTVQQWAMDPNEPHSMYEWFNPALDAIVQHTSSEKPLVVAVLDTGISETALQAFKHPLMQGYDFVSDPAISLDGDGRDSSWIDPGL